LHPFPGFSLGCINFFEKKGQILLSGSRFGLKVGLFLLFKLGNCSALIRVIAVLITRGISHVESLRNIRKLVDTTGYRSSFLIHFDITPGGFFQKIQKVAVDVIQPFY
jgi:hypothetical protein